MILKAVYIAPFSGKTRTEIVELSYRDGGCDRDPRDFVRAAIQLLDGHDLRDRAAIEFYIDDERVK